ncbi:MAG TPA: hypothetical protein VD970_02600, partial [Acetobacteraceae bacterium]|nr:hypothetical protein [Acetobacteraceae bacterium]
MSPRERFIGRVRARLRRVEPGIRAAYLRSLREVVAGLPARERERLLATGIPDALIGSLFSDTHLLRPLAPLRVAVQEALTKGVVTFARDVPHAAAAGEVFGVLSPRVVQAIRTADTKVLTRVGEVLRGSVRAIAEQGYAAGAGPRTTARALRDLIGLGPAEVQQVENFRAALRGEGRSWLYYERRDRRYDATVARALDSGGRLSEVQVERMAGAYARRRLALSA